MGKEVDPEQLRQITDRVRAEKQAEQERHQAAQRLAEQRAQRANEASAEDASERLVAAAPQAMQLAAQAGGGYVVLNMRSIFDMHEAYLRSQKVQDLAYEKAAEALRRKGISARQQAVEIPPDEDSAGSRGSFLLIWWNEDGETTLQLGGNGSIHYVYELCSRSWIDRLLNRQPEGKIVWTKVV